VEVRSIGKPRNRGNRGGPRGLGPLGKCTVFSNHSAARTHPPLITPIEDPNIEPAQFSQPGTLPAVSPTPSVPRVVADPPSPVVRILVRVPADAAPGDDLKYIITVQNVSQADAHQVAVRNPIPEGVLQVGKVEPQPDAKLTTDKQLGWSFGTLKAGEKKTIELAFKTKPDVKEIKNLAYVRFEHGEAVTTKITGRP